MIRVCATYFLLHLTLINSDLNITEEKSFYNVTLNEVSDKIVNLFGVDHRKGKIKDLKQKIARINSYVVDNTLALTNMTSVTNLNKTNFYKALKDDDHYRLLKDNDGANLYLKLKANLNRDDILGIIANRSDNGKLIKSARRMLNDPIPKKVDDEKINDVVDKFIGEVPRDDHRAKASESIYWDPQNELEDLKEYHDAKRSGRRIFKGERTTIREYPFMASIHIMGRFWCGGVLYWHDLVITSASCLQLMHNNRFFRENPQVLEIRMGSNHSRVGGETIGVLEVYFHPSYNPKTLWNNLAVMRLRRHLAFTYHRIPKIIDITHEPTLIPATAEITVLGWGVTKISQKMAFEPIYLQRKVLPVYPNTFCREIYGRKFVTHQMFCAGTVTTGEGACDHDAGGPAILNGRLIGIISFGPATCGFANAPTVFTLVGAFADWIETVNESMPNYYRGKAQTTSSTKSELGAYFSTWKKPRTPNRETIKIQPIMTEEQIYPTATATPSEATATEEATTETSTSEATNTASTSTTSPERVIRIAESDGGWSIEHFK